MFGPTSTRTMPGAWNLDVRRKRPSVATAAGAHRSNSFVSSLMLSPRSPLLVTARRESTPGFFRRSSDSRIRMSHFTWGSRWTSLLRRRTGDSSEVAMKTVLVLISLAVAPPAHAHRLDRPKTEVPREWSQPPSAPPSTDVETLRNWWRMFGDSTLTSLVSGAIESNLDLKEAAARVSEVRAARGVAASALQPSIATSEGYTRVRGGIAQGLARAGILSNSPQSRASLIAPFETNVFQLGFDSFWELDLAGGLRKSVKAADADIRATEEARNDVRVLVAAEVGRNYVALRGSQRQLSIVRANIALQEDSVRLTESRQRAGLAPELDVVR